MSEAVPLLLPRTLSGSPASPSASLSLSGEMLKDSLEQSLMLRKKSVLRKGLPGCPGDGPAATVT